MNKTQAFVVICVVSTLLLFGFNNCGSDVQFAPIEDAVSQSSTGSGGSDSDVAPATQDQIDQVTSNIPPEDLENPRPITDLLNDPSLFDTYACDSTSVLICHFPNNVEAQGTSCIGRSAVTSHYSHTREYIVDNDVRTISDYLGPCRVAL